MDNMILKAAEVARQAHLGQFRKYGHSTDPYIWHPMRVAGLVSLVQNATSEMVQAAWLHDVIEDTDVTETSLLLKGFGGDVAYFVRRLTNPSKGSKASRAERKAMDREHIQKAQWEIRMIKLADRLDNIIEVRNDVQTPPDFVKLYLAETRMLLKVLEGTHPEMEKQLADLVKE